MKDTDIFEILSHVISKNKSNDGGSKNRNNRDYEEHNIGTISLEVKKSYSAKEMAQALGELHKFHMDILMTALKILRLHAKKYYKKGVIQPLDEITIMLDGFSDNFGDILKDIKNGKAKEKEDDEDEEDDD